MSTPIAVFASGRGSNLDAIVAAIRSGRLDAEIVAVVSDQPGALALEKARAAGFRAICVPCERVEGQAVEARRRAHEGKILEALVPLRPRFLVLAGYMRVVTSTLLDAFRSERGYARVVNVHPSLLPAFPGVGSYEQAFLHGTKVAGVTVHLVELEVDSGPICAQEAFSIAGCASAAEVERLGLAVEHRLYPEALSWVLPERFSYELPSPSKGTRRHVRPN